MLGITVLPEYFQVEGIEPVLDNCQYVAGADAVTTSPYVMRLAADGEGQREPPVDAGAGAVRILDRPLWGRRELQVSTSPSFNANRSLYSKTCYEPPVGDRFTDEGGTPPSLFAPFPLLICTFLNDIVPRSGAFDRNCGIGSDLYR